MRNLKQFLNSVLLLSVVSLAQAKAWDSPNDAMKVQEKISLELSDVPGINGIGLAICDPDSGEQVYDEYEDHVYCVLINTQNATTFKKMKKRFPVGKSVDGVFVVVGRVGPIGPYPKISTGN